ncbi:MAG: hypothetical protein NZ893_03040 [Candidatus Aenigmarchaeota archaeon]|nr:hypothetical protein [Candidatus Aenigmarchaeota archaeon]
MVSGCEGFQQLSLDPIIVLTTIHDFYRRHFYEVAVPSDSVHSGYPANIFYLCFDGSLTIPIDDCLDGGDDISWEQESYLRSLRFLGF